MDVKKFFLISILLWCFSAMLAVSPEDPEEDTLGEPFGAPVFPDEMYVSLWSDTAQISYQHSDTIADTEYGRCVNYNRLEFAPHGETEVIMTWYASAEFENGFTAGCVYVYRGKRDLNVVMLESRFPEGSEEAVEPLEPSSPRSTVNLFSPTQLRFNNRIFNRVCTAVGGK